MRTSTIFTIAALAGMALAGCGEVAQEVQTAVQGYECPMTDEYDYFVELDDMDETVDGIINKEDSVPGQVTDFQFFEDNTASVDVWDENGCHITHHNVIGLEN